MKDIIFETIEKRFLQGLLSLPCGGKDGAFGSFTDYGFEDVSLINDSKLAGIWRTAQIANLEGIVLTPNDYLLKLPNVAKKHNINIDLATLCEVSTGGNSYHLAEDFAALQERKARLRYFDLQRALNDSIKNGDTADEMSEIVQKFMLTMDDTSAATDDTLIDLNNLAPTEEDGVPLLYIGGAPALKTQNVQVITAVAGQGKSQLVKLLAGAMFRPQGIIEPVAKGGKVLIIDTEQDTSDLKREVAVILRLSGNNADNRHLEVHRFVGLSVAERRAKYVRFIRKFKPDLCIIDGISDLMADPNSMAESVEICNELKALATTCNCAILCVLHQNESADNTKESKVRGFIGSELTRKATTIFRVNSKVIDGTKIFTVEDKKSRNISFPDFSFIISKDGIPTIISGATLSDIKNKQKAGTLSELFRGVYDDDVILSRTDLCKKLVTSFDVSTRTANSRITEASNLGIIKKDESGKYVFVQMCNSVKNHAICTDAK